MWTTFSMTPEEIAKIIKEAVYEGTLLALREHDLMKREAELEKKEAEMEKKWKTKT